MAGTDRTRPFVFCLLALLLYAGLEIVLFRTDAYLPILSSESMQGRVRFMFRHEATRPPTGKKEVLLTGDSVMEFGFWTGLFERENPSSPVVFLMRSVPASPLSFWYYALDEIDPRHDRYAAIVIPVHGYKIFPQTVDEANRYDIAQMLASALPPGAYFDLVGTYTDPGTRYRAVMIGIFANHNFALDLQDLVAHPLNRFSGLAERRRKNPDWMGDDPGDPATVASLHVDADGEVGSFPQSFDLFKQKTSAAEFIRQPPDRAKYLEDRDARFYRFWIGRIVALYHGSPTKLIFLPDPRWPLPLPARLPLAEAPDLRELTPHADNVVWLDETMFTDLERPLYYQDLVHLNRAGRKIFTERLSGKIVSLLSP